MSEEDRSQAPYESPTPQVPANQSAAGRTSGFQQAPQFQPVSTASMPPTAQPSYPLQQPPYGPNSQPAYPREGRWNVCAILGLIFGFVFAIVGLILSIVGLTQIKRTHEKGRGLAVAGIVVSVIMMISGGVMAYNLMNAIQQAQLTASPTTSFSASAPSASDSDASSPSGSASSSDGAADLDSDAGQGLSELEQDDSSLSSAYGSMSELVADPEFQSEMKSTIDESFEGTGADVNMRAEGDALVIDIHLPNEYDDAADQINQQFSANAEEQFQPMADSLVGLVRTDGSGPQVRMYLHTDDQTLYDQTFTGK